MTEQEGATKERRQVFRRLAKDTHRRQEEGDTILFENVLKIKASIKEAIENEK